MSFSQLKALADVQTQKYTSIYSFILFLIMHIYVLPSMAYGSKCHAQVVQMSP